MNTNLCETSSSTLIPQGHRTRSSPRLREKQVMFQVLDNPSLREEILKHIIFGGDQVDHRATCILRHVQRSWNESVLRILWNAHQPLYRIPSGAGSLLTIIKTFAVSSSHVNRPPPPPLELDELCEEVRQRNVHNFSHLLTNCGPALVKMGIRDYWFGVPSPVALPLQWSLPRLHKLILKLGLQPRSGTPGKALTTQLDVSSECVIKSILRGATALTELELILFEFAISGDKYLDLTAFESIILPPSLVKVTVRTELAEQPFKAFMEALAGSQLPKLTSLSLFANDSLFNNGLLLCVMDQCRGTLKSVEIVEDRYYIEPPRHETLVRFPVMEQLETLFITSISAELESGLRSLERCFPKLRTLCLHHQTLGMFRKWTASSRFSGVTCLELLLADEHVRGFEADSFFVSASEEVLHSVNLAFPNLRKLEVGISASDPSGLQYVFQEMRQLVELKLKVFGDTTGITSHVWDSILTGMPSELMEGSPEEFPDDFVNAPSIKNLKELKSFAMKDYRSILIRIEENVDGFPRSLISEFIFDHALLQMPMLSHLHFEGPFKVSDEMTENWLSEQRRALIYEPFLIRDRY